MSGILWLALALVLPNDPPTFLATDFVDSIEINHYHDQQGHFVLNQLIYRNWSETDLRFHVSDYRLRKHARQMPICDFGSSLHHSYFYDGHSLLKVSSYSVAETWTQIDPEYAERRFLQNQKRAGLATQFEVGKTTR